MRALLLILFLAASGHAFAQINLAPAYPLAPYSQPSWLSPSESGSGFLFGQLPRSALLFGAYYTYTADGSSSWLVFQGPYAPASEAERLATGVIGRAHSPLYSASGGACPTCAYTAPTLRQSALGEAELVFTGAMRAQLTFAGGAKTLVPLDTVTTTTVPDLLEGTWSGTARYVSDPYTIRTESCRVTFTRVPNPSPIDRYERESPDVRNIPSPGSLYLRAKDVTTGTAQGPSCATVFYDAHLAVDPVTLRVRQYSFYGVLAITDPASGAVLGYKIAHDGRAGELYLVTPTRIVARYDRNIVSSTDLVAELQLDREITTPP